MMVPFSVGESVFKRMNSSRYWCDGNNVSGLQVKEVIDFSRTNKIIFAESIDSMCCVADIASVVSDWQVRVMVFPMRNPRYCINECECLIMILKFIFFTNAIFNVIPSFQTVKHQMNLRFRNGIYATFARLAFLPNKIFSNFICQFLSSCSVS